MEQRCTGRQRNMVYLAAVAVALLLLVVGVWQGAPAVPAASGGEGVARSVDVEELRRQIGEGRLSGREAEFYRVLKESESR